MWPIDFNFSFFTNIVLDISWRIFAFISKISPFFDIKNNLEMLGEIKKGIIYREKTNVYVFNANFPPAMKMWLTGKKSE